LKNIQVLNIFNKNNSIPTQFKQIILETTIKYGNEADWLWIYENAIKSKVNREKMDFIKALTHTQNYNLLKL